MILRRQGKNPLLSLTPALTRADVLSCREIVHATYLSDAVVQYLVSIVGSTRVHPDLDRGASPRAALAVSAMAKAVARMRGRDFVVPGDVREVLTVTLSHRVNLSAAAQAHGRRAEDILTEIADAAPVPGPR